MPSIKGALVHKEDLIFAFMDSLVEKANNT